MEARLTTVNTDIGSMSSLLTNMKYVIILKLSAIAYKECGCINSFK